MSPYIVTVKRGGGVVSRRAVATLDEARAVTGECVKDAAGVIWDTRQSPTWKAALGAAKTMDGDYSKIGPLPDGTVIEVERVSWRLAAEQARAAGRMVWVASRGWRAEIIDAYNAAQEEMPV